MRLGIKNDLRGEEVVKKRLRRRRDEYAGLVGDKKKEFDKESLVNPFSDTRLFTTSPDKPVRRILVGIDIGPSEVLIAQELSKKKPIDLILAHHPIGPALAGLHEVMDLQIELLAHYGVPINIADKLTRKRISEIERAVSPAIRRSQAQAISRPPPTQGPRIAATVGCGQDSIAASASPTASW